MSNQLRFTKYTAHGNNFVVLDETQNPQLTEDMKREFAWYATNVNFGIGCDNLLVLENANHTNLARINEYRRYWPKTPDLKSARYVFRMFEPDGSEALSCGNGLMCIADYLYHQYGVEHTQIMTRIPSSQPLAVEIGKAENQAGTWVNLGIPHKTPSSLISQSNVYACTEAIDCLRDIKIHLRGTDLKAFTDREELRIAGYIVFTGEPHLVIFVESGLSITELNDLIFISPGSSLQISGRQEKRYSFGGWLLRQVGLYLNKQRRDIFPNGINVNFARIIQNGSTSVEYRTFERGINKETLSCGTGAVAVAYVASQLNLISQTPIDLWPHMARWFDSEVRLRVSGAANGWRLNATPKKVFHGTYNLSSEGANDVDKQDASLAMAIDDSFVLPHTKEMIEEGLRSN